VRSKSRARQRGFAYVEYLIVSITVSFVLAAGVYKIGPTLAGHHKTVVKTVIEKAP
jgi:hypothetical protein